MRNLLWLLCLALSALASGVENRYLLFPDKVPSLSRVLSANHVIFADGDVTLAILPEDKIEGLSTWVHENLKACGGFIDVTASVEAGKAPWSIVWEEVQRKSKKTNFIARGPVEANPLIASLVSQASEVSYRAFLNSITAFPDRSATTENGKLAAAFFRQQATSLAANLTGFSTQEVATGTGFYKQPSIVATYPGLSKELPHVVIGAHMDTYSNGKPGADDDGSGSAIVLEVLRAIASRGAKFNRTIDLIWYAAEERGLVGSSYVVSAFEAAKTPVLAAIQFDMVGYNSDKDSDDIYLITDYTDATLTQRLKTLIQTYTNAKVGTTECGYACSDHANWMRAGIPAAFPFESTFSNMNHRLHTEDDKMEFLDMKHATRFAQVGLAFLGDVAELVAVETK